MSVRVRGRKFEWEPLVYNSFGEEEAGGRTSERIRISSQKVRCTRSTDFEMTPKDTDKENVGHISIRYHFHLNCITAQRSTHTHTHIAWRWRLALDL